MVFECKPYLNDSPCKDKKKAAKPAAFAYLFN